MTEPDRTIDARIAEMCEAVPKSKADYRIYRIGKRATKERRAIEAFNGACTFRQCKGI